MQSMIDKTFAPGPRHAAARLGRGGAIVRRHLLGGINDILDFSKIESGHLELEAVDFNLVDTAEEALAMFAHPAAAKIFAHWPLELAPPLTIAQTLVGQRTAETASPIPLITTPS